MTTTSSPSANGSRTGTASPQQNASLQQDVPSQNRSGLVGHTCAWTVRRHLSRAAFRALKNFCGIRPSLEATIRRKQLEIAVRRASASTSRRLRLVRRDVVDATQEHASKLPVIGHAGKKYRLPRNQTNAASASIYAALKRLYEAESDTIHTTVVASIVKRYVRSSLAGFSLRDHGGVYFVSAAREAKLFALADFLASRDIGHITRFGVGGSAHETAVLSEEIRRITQSQVDELREAFEESDLGAARDRARLRKKVKRAREALSEMQDLFGFASQVLSLADAEARGLMKRVIRGEREVKGGDLFSEHEHLPALRSPAAPNKRAANTT